MALVDPSTGGVVKLLDEAGARELTERIKSAAEQVWALLLEAHERQATRRSRRNPPGFASRFR